MDRAFCKAATRYSDSIWNICSIAYSYPITAVPTSQQLLGEKKGVCQISDWYLKDSAYHKAKRCNKEDAPGNKTNKRKMRWKKKKLSSRSNNKSATWHLYYTLIVVVGRYCVLGVFIDVANSKWRLRSAKLLKCNKKCRPAKPWIYLCSERGACACATLPRQRSTQALQTCTHCSTQTNTQKCSSVLAKCMSSVTCKLQRQHAA